MTIAATCRKLGQRRLTALARIASPADWKRLWPKPRFAYPFTWGECWKAVAEFGVEDYAAELGFHLDILGMTANATWDDHAMIMTPDGAYAFTIYKAKRTAADLNLQFMLGNIGEATARLKRRGVAVVEDITAAWGKDNPMRTFKTRTPNGIGITLWGFLPAKRRVSRAAAP